MPRQPMTKRDREVRIEEFVRRMYEAFHDGADWLDEPEVNRKESLEMMAAIIGEIEGDIDEVLAVSEGLHPHDKRPYPQTCNMLLTQLNLGWSFAFGISPAAVTRTFTAVMHDVISKEYPQGLRRSALRRAIEGDLTNGNCPVSMIPHGLRNRAEKVLALADACETVLYHQARQKDATE